MKCPRINLVNIKSIKQIECLKIILENAKSLKKQYFRINFEDTKSLKYIFKMYQNYSKRNKIIETNKMFENYSSRHKICKKNKMVMRYSKRHKIIEINMF